MGNIKTELLVRVAARMIIINAVWQELEKYFHGRIMPSTADTIIFLIMAYFVYKREETRYEKQDI